MPRKNKTYGWSMGKNPKPACLGCGRKHGEKIRTISSDGTEAFQKVVLEKKFYKVREDGVEVFINKCDVCECFFDSMILNFLRKAIQEANPNEDDGFYYFRNLGRA